MCTSLKLHFVILYCVPLSFISPTSIFFCCSVKEILGYDPKDLCAEGVSMKDFVHPADQIMMKRRPKVECRKYMYQYYTSSTVISSDEENFCELC